MLRNVKCCEMNLKYHRPCLVRVVGGDAVSGSPGVIFCWLGLGMGQRTVAGMGCRAAL